jgi:methyl-accepting chemotaxis protein
MNLNDMKISTRLMLGFATLCALIALLGAVAYVKVHDIGTRFSGVMDDRYPEVAALNDIALANAANARALRDLVLADSAAALQPPLDELAANSKLINDRFKRLTDSVASDEGKAQLARVADARSAYSKPRDKVRQLVKAGDKAGATAALYAELHPAQLKYQAAVDEFVAFQEKSMAAARGEVDRAISSTTLSVLVLVATALGLGTILALWIVRSTTRPLALAVTVARGVANGDLSQRFDAEGRNETAQLLQALRDMQANLSRVVSSVRSNSESVATASAQIAAGNNDLSNRTEQQASALEETASSMEQMTATVAQNADNARLANQLAMGASDVAAKGGEVVGQVVETMKGINDSSKKIVDIIGVIDGIAFQTNILALNAAVEAARAGEQGRGFAVVASEVRNLAGRSADAAKEIRSLISASVERVEAGTTQVDHAGQTMSEVVHAIRRVTELMGGISAASAEQSAGVAQVGEAISNMDQATQQNASLVEQSAAAAESLKIQARQLVESVAVFKLDAGTTPEPMRPAVDAAARPVRPASTPSAPAASRPSAAAAARPATRPAVTAAPAPALADTSDDWHSF